MSERPRNEKNEKDEKGRNESWDEKWRRDPVEAAVWAFVLIWAGVAWLLSYYGFWDPFLKDDSQWWGIIFLGGGVIVILGVFARLVVPAWRRPWVGSLIFGLVLLGIGLGIVTNDWVLIGPLVLIGIGIAGLAAFFTRRKE
jgi:energy-converting hydrogenase Eha subunit E